MKTKVYFAGAEEELDQQLVEFFGYEKDEQGWFYYEYEENERMKFISKLMEEIEREQTSLRKRDEALKQKYLKLAHEYELELQKMK